MHGLCSLRFIACKVNKNGILNENFYWSFNIKLSFFTGVILAMYQPRADMADSMPLPTGQV